MFSLLSLRRFSLGCLLVASIPASTLAVEPSHGEPSLRTHTNEKFVVRPSADRFLTKSVAAREDMHRFVNKHGLNWEVNIDRRSGRAALIQGPGVRVDLKNGTENAVRVFMNEFPEMFGGITAAELRLDPHTSQSFRGYFHNVELQQLYEGVPIKGAKIFFRINNGNIIQFGNHLVSTVRGLNPTPNMDAAAARQILADGAGVALDELSFFKPDALMIYPAMLEGERPGLKYQGLSGLGLTHNLVWELWFQRRGDDTSYMAVVDAHSGRLESLTQEDSFAQVTGGILPTTTSDPEQIVGLPFTTVTDNGGTKITDANGNYTYSGGTATASLNGRYINIQDSCGSISLSSGDGNLNFGSSSGTNCTTPGIGGSGNTHSARSGYYHLTNINRKAATFDPSNSWLDGTLTAKMNLTTATCNAKWSPGTGTVDFYQSSGSCGNTGEIAAVFLHEWGHGYDTNAGGPTTDRGSSEAFADTMAILELKDSCIGPGFYSTPSCNNCDVCTGVRDVEEFSLSGNHTIASPSTIEDNNGINCDYTSCPSGYAGVMGYQGHCESYIASSANWDLAQMLVAEHGTTVGWETMDAIWYGSIYAADNAYQISSGGQCNPSADVNGCGSDNWYTVYLAVDDDDGNLANGTPNGCRIWDAFNAHGIACGSRPTCTTGGSCTVTENPETSCSDGLDNDCDGLFDSGDPDCAPTCTPTENPEASCSDGQDNDCDGLIDAADPDCAPSCAASGASCTSNSDCCSNKCRGKSGSQTCR